MKEEINKTVGDETLGASANASAGTEVTDTSVSAVEKGRIPYRYYKEMLKETFNTKEK